MILLEDNLIRLVQGQLPRKDRVKQFWATRVRRSTAATLQNELVEMTRSRVGTQTIPNWFHEREFNARRPAKVIP
jgi:hypothetical protein